MKKILVPIDFSEVTAALIEAATEQSLLNKGELYLLHIEAPEPDFMGYKPGPQTERDSIAHIIKERSKELEKIENSLKGKGVKVKAMMLQGPTVKVILKEAERFKVDLIVIGSHGHGGLHNLFLGSISKGVLRGARCPILIVPSKYYKNSHSY